MSIFTEKENAKLERLGREDWKSTSKKSIITTTTILLLVAFVNFFIVIKIGNSADKNFIEMIKMLLSLDEGQRVFSNLEVIGLVYLLNGVYFLVLAIVFYFVARSFVNQENLLRKCVVSSKEESKE